MNRRAPPKILGKLNKKPHFELGERLASDDAIHHEGTVYLSERADRAFLAGQKARLEEARKRREE